MSHYYQPRRVKNDHATGPARPVHPITYRRSPMERHGELIVALLGAAVFGFACALLVVGFVIL